MHIVYELIKQMGQHEDGKLSYPHQLLSCHTLGLMHFELIKATLIVLPSWDFIDFPPEPFVRENIWRRQPDGQDPQNVKSSAGSSGSECPSNICLSGVKIAMYDIILFFIFSLTHVLFNFIYSLLFLITVWFRLWLMPCSIFLVVIPIFIFT